MLALVVCGVRTETPWAETQTEVCTGQKGVTFVQNHRGRVIAEKCLLHSSNGWEPKTLSYHTLSSESILAHSMKPMQAPSDAP